MATTTASPEGFAEQDQAKDYGTSQPKTSIWRSTRTYLGVLIIVLWGLLPFYWMVVTAFRDLQFTFDTTPWPTHVTLDNFRTVFATNRGNHFGRALVNSLMGTNIIWFSEKWPARAAIVIADVWKTTPFMALLILAGLQLISSEIYEAAKVDGASAWQRFTSITLPLVKPALMVALLFRTLDVLRMYDLPQIMTGGGAGDGNDTTTLSILVVQEVRSNFNSAAALSTLTFLFVFLVAFLFIRFLGANVVDDGQRKR